MGRRTINRSSVARLHEQLAAAGLPVVSVRLLRGQFEIELTPDATPQQNRQAEQLAAAFDANAESSEVQSLRQLQQDMSSAGFQRLTGVEKLERIRAALELLIKDMVS